MPSVSGNVGAVASVSSVFGRNGGVVAANGDYSGVVAAHLTGATAATRYVGGTASGAPVAGTFAVGDFVVDQSGAVWVCTVAGTPGTWVAPGGSSPLVKTSVTLDDATIRGLPSLFPGHELVGPVGSGKAAVVVHATLQTVGFKTHPYGNIDPDGVAVLRVGLVGVTSDIFNMSSPVKLNLTDFLNQAHFSSDTDADLWLLIPSFVYDNDWGGAVPQVLGSGGNSVENGGIYFGINSNIGDLSGGDAANKLVVTLLYYLVDIAT